MARLGLGLLAAAAVAVLALASGAASQAPAPAPAPSSSADCGAAVQGLLPCLSYVQAGSPQGKPTAPCCAGVKGALKSPATVSCLCAAFGQTYPVAINMTRAATLPADCGGDPAAFSKCNSERYHNLISRARRPLFFFLRSVETRFFKFFSSVNL
jgi:hypothetical protein